MAEKEPAEVVQAREVIRAWELRNGHDAYPEPLDGGWKGYQARCWDCDWRGIEYLCGIEKVSNESRDPKRQARLEAAEHRKATTPEDWHADPVSGRLEETKRREK